MAIVDRGTPVRPNAVDGLTLVSQYRPGLRLIVQYRDDPGWWHERLLLYPVHDRLWVVLTADDDEYAEPVAGWVDVIVMSNRRRYPRGLAGSIVQFSAPLSDAEMEQRIRQGRRLAYTERTAAGITAAAFRFNQTHYVTWHNDLKPIPPDTASDGIRRRLFGKRPPPVPAGPTGPAPVSSLDGEPPLAAQADRPPTPAGYVWVTNEVIPGSSVALGTVVDLALDAPVIGDVALHRDLASGNCYTCRRLALTEVPAYIGRIQRSLVDGDTTPPKAEPDLRDRLGFGKAPDEVAEGPEDEITSPDPRLLVLERDERGERFKPWRTVVGESFDCNRYEDFPIPGDPVCLAMCRHFERHGGNPQLWQDKWEQSKGIEDHERTHIELTCHMRTLYLFGTYDQFNLGASAAMENVARRAAQIIEAYRVDPTRPAWHTVKYFVDEAGALDPVPLSLRQANTRKIKDEIEVDTFRLRQKGAGAQADGGDPSQPAPRQPAQLQQPSGEAGGRGGKASRRGRGRVGGALPAAPP